MANVIKGMTPLLQVYDMPTSMDFYCKTLGFEVGAVDDPKKSPHHDWVWLKRGEIDLMLNTAYESDQRPALPDPKRVAAHDDVCLYFGAPDVDTVYHDLLAKGLKLNPPTVAWYGMKQLTLHDPDGYAICFQWKAEPEKK
jgi:glyoxylase I family protein